MKPLTKDLIDLFLDPEGAADLFKQPFIWDDYLYATNGISAIRVPLTNVDFDIAKLPLNISPKLVEHFKTITKYQSPCILNKAIFELGKRHTKTKKVRDRVACTECNETGTVDWTYSGKTQTHNKEYNCPICDGSGNEVEAKFVDTDQKTFATMDHIHFEYCDKHQFFRAHNFDKIFQVFNHTGGNLEIGSYAGNNKGLSFCVKDCFEIILMPIVPTHDDNEFELRLNANGWGYVFTMDFT
jgi:hypothetical protein